MHFVRRSWGRGHDVVQIISIIADMENPMAVYNGSVQSWHVRVYDAGIITQHHWSALERSACPESSLTRCYLLNPFRGLVV